MRRIILASGSPRRKRLLKQLIGDTFKVVIPDYEEDNDLGLEPIKMAKHHALGKARAVARNFPDAIVIGCDTFGMIDGEILGKPDGETGAIAMLRKISGRTLKVFSGVALIDSKSGEELVDHEISEVTMSEMSESEIKAYVATGEPLDKAASFATQGKGAVFVERIKGCYFNVVGFPLFKVNLLLKQAGVDVLEYS